jgi:quinol monooxygenase YgiN
MPLVLTYQARSRDWKKLQALSRETLAPQAREVGALRYQLYRNTHDAAELLIVVEVADRDAGSELCKALNDQLAGLLAGSEPDSRFWEPCG